MFPQDTYCQAGKENHPINCVNWTEAIAYCDFVGKRLPTSAEREWAARGTTRGSTYPWGESPPEKQLCWHRLDYTTSKGKGTCPVHSFPKGDTPQGIADFEGNVEEWTSTSMKSGGAVAQGGDWMECDPRSLEVGVEHYWKSQGRLPGVGFRCVADGPTPTP